jgi:hypothetical protein
MKYLRWKYIRRLLIAGVVGYVLLLLWQGVPFYFQIRKVLVSDKTILAIKKGAFLDEVKNVLGIAARHEFTVSLPNGTYTLISCLGTDPDGNRFWFLFHDQVLEKMIYPLPPPSERVPYEGTTATRGKSWDIDDQTRIINTIAGPALTQDQVAADLKPYDGKGESWSVVPAALIVAVLTAGPIQFRYMDYIRDEYKVNFDYLSRYDGCKASLGMSGEQIEAMFGKPLRVFYGKNGEIVRIYGRTRVFDLNWSYRFSGLAIVIDTQDHVTAVYGDQFFDDSWAGRSESY